MGRFFAFGCSYTNCWGATWADFIGINFEEYHNYGRGGSSNTYIMNRLIEVDERIGFGADDMVIVMLTGFNRFTYLTDQGWQTCGDMYSNYSSTKDAKLGTFLRDMWSEKWSVYQSWIAAKAMKRLLESKNIPHVFLMGIDNSHYMKEEFRAWGRTNKSNLMAVEQTKEIYEIVMTPVSLDEWKNERYTREDHVFFANENRIDMHPTQKMHYAYVKDLFPQYITEKTHEMLEEVESITNYSSQSNQGHAYQVFQNKINKAGWHQLTQ